MEITLPPAEPRSLIRRLVPWTAAMGLFAGGGYGVYRYALPPKASAAETAAAVDGAQTTATTLSEVDKQLFSAPAKNDSRTAYADSRYADRYAASPATTSKLAAPPALPPARGDEPVESPRSAEVVAPPVNPFVAKAVGGEPDRYDAATALTAAVAEVADKTATPAAAEINAPAAPRRSQAVAPSKPASEEMSEVARGQEPAGDNPLRAVATRPAVTTESKPAGATNDEARAAFGDGASLSQPKPLNVSAAPRPLASAKSNGSEPTQQSAAQASPAASDRYPGSSNQNPAAPTLGPNDYADANSTPADNAAPLPTAGDRQFKSATAGPLDPPTGAVGDRKLDLRPNAALARESAADGGITPTPGLAQADGAGRPGEQLLEGVQSPTLAIQKLAPPEIQVGKKCTFAIRVQNTGQRTAHNVQVRDEIPLGTQLVGAAPKANVSGSQLVWDLGTLSAGEERIVEMELIPTDEGELGSVATVTFAAQASAKVRCTKPELALRLSSGPRVMIGQQHIVQIEISNPGSGDATGVMLLESVPTGVSHEAGPALEFEVGTLKAGESRRLDLVLTAEQAGRVNNVMTARADANLEVQANCEFEVLAPALKVSVEGPQKRYLERPATYTVNIENPGTASAKEVQLVTQLPPGLQFVSANNMGEYDAATHSVHWSLAELPANERGAVELTALPVEAGEHTLAFATRAQQGLEDRAETRITVEGLVALSFEVEAVDGAIEVGGETSYQITVSNQGSKPAANVQVTAIIPPGLRAKGGEGDARNVVQGDRVTFAPLAQLAPKAEAKFRVFVQGVQPGDQRTKVLVTADEVEQPISKEQSTRVYADQ